MKRFWLATMSLLWAYRPGDAQSHRRPSQYRFEATAFSRHGTTAYGTVSHVGTIAADPRILPFGTRVRVSGAGPYSGTYVVTDTGAKVEGRQIDLYMRSHTEAKRFGRRAVHVKVLHWGDGEQASR